MRTQGTDREDAMGHGVGTGRTGGRERAAGVLRAPPDQRIENARGVRVREWEQERERERGVGADIPGTREGEGDATPREETIQASEGGGRGARERGGRSGGGARYVAFVLSLFIGPLFFAVGLASLAGGLYTGYTTARWLGHAATTTAQVTGSVDEGQALGADQGTEQYCPLLTFYTADGVAVTVVPPAASQLGLCNTRPLTPGAALAVRYPPDAPDEARVDSFMGLWGDALLDIVGGLRDLLVGGVPALIDLYLARAWLRDRRRASAGRL